ncbi:sensor histidine kinase [Novosphingobium sp. FSY-8]|uniref:histidine kinase n=1 Tax=Novosphingobium ovatum TaxID=1908523 RepID=A0ABW9XHM6_9SPHN|nr:HAMP domain-containing histidine kinase [Novosphingobium ovatum]NBC38067.1 sensor histidine kinase [Novosphingobium ovatum]
MRYDDRLATVLRLTPNGPSVARIQFRQLLDLIGTAPCDVRGEQYDQAYLRLADLSRQIAAVDRAAMLDQPGLRLRSARLVAALCNGESNVAAAAIRAAQLTDEQWVDLIPVMPLHARRWVRLRDDLGDGPLALLTRLGIDDFALPEGAGPQGEPVASPRPIILAEDQPDPTPPDPTPPEPTPPAPNTTPPRGGARRSPQRALAGVAKGGVSRPAGGSSGQGMGHMMQAGGATPDIPDVATPDIPAHDVPAPDAAALAATVAEATLAAGSALPADDDIGALVRRIETFRRARDLAANSTGDSPRLPLEDEGSDRRGLNSFDFASDGEGRIVWCDPNVAPMVVGHLLGGSLRISNAISQHQPLRAVRITLDGAPAVAGDWQVDAVPRFDPTGGRFIGHLGRFRRPGESALRVVADDTPAAKGESEADRLRQLLHELRTPVNAIQGFAEIIQQQLFGPAPHEYRALAAVIAADSARMLAGFEELDRFAKLASGAMELTAGTSDFAEALRATVARLQPQGAAQGPRLTLVEAGAATAPVALDPIEAERLCWRLLATITGNAGAQEEIALRLERAGDAVYLTCALPAVLADLADEALYHAAALPAPPAPSAGMFGTGFALRLAGAELRAAGGQLTRCGANLRLMLPLVRPIVAPAEPSDMASDLTQAVAQPSKEPSTAGTGTTT